MAADPERDNLASADSPGAEELPDDQAVISSGDRERPPAPRHHANKPDNGNSHQPDGGLATGDCCDAQDAHEEAHDDGTGANVSLHSGRQMNRHSRCHVDIIARDQRHRQSVPPAGIEPATRGLGNRCSIH